MIDLSLQIRSFIIATPSVASLIPSYQNSRQVFTRRPAPVDSKGLVVMVSPQIGGGVESDYLKNWQRELTYDLACYGPNDTATNYRKVEQVAFALANAFHRLNKRSFPAIDGWTLTRTKAFGPMPAPTDDQTITGRMVTIQFLLTQNTAS